METLTRHHPTIFTTTLIFLTLLLLTTAAAAAAAAVKERCHPDDKKVLLSIMQSLHNQFPSWVPTTDCCRYWHGVKCDPTNHRVNSLAIVDSLELPATIPPSVGHLPYLKYLIFHKLINNLTGTIPSTVGDLRHLIIADFSWNSLSGPIPSFFHRNQALIGLDLSFNLFSESIPPELSLAPNLFSLQISRNHLTGAIPDAFGFFNQTSNFYLDLSHNHLVGPIPRSLGNINFTQLDLSRNNLTGDAAFLFKGVLQLDLSRNQLAFDFSTVKIPSGVTPSSVTSVSIDVSHNRIFGSIPPAPWKNVEYLNVSYNRLCGPIPPSDGALTSFDQSVFFHNKCLCGPPLGPCNSTT